MAHWNADTVCRYLPDPAESLIECVINPFPEALERKPHWACSPAAAGENCPPGSASRSSASGSPTDLDRRWEAPTNGVGIPATYRLLDAGRLSPRPAFVTRDERLLRSLDGISATPGALTGVSGPQMAVSSPVLPTTRHNSCPNHPATPTRWELPIILARSVIESSLRRAATAAIRPAQILSVARVEIAWFLLPHGPRHTRPR